LHSQLIKKDGIFWYGVARAVTNLAIAVCSNLRLDQGPRTL